MLAMSLAVAVVPGRNPPVEPARPRVALTAEGGMTTVEALGRVCLDADDTQAG